MLSNIAACQGGLAELEASDFSLGTHRQIFEAIRKLTEDGCAIDATTVGSEIPDLRDQLHALAEAVPTISHARDYFSEVRGAAQMRRIASEAEQLRFDALRHDESAVDEHLRTVMAIRKKGRDGVPRQLDGLVAVRASDLAPEEVHWLWEKRIPLGKLTLCAGDPGLGKSLLT